ncbi:MAG TPA: thioredoxin family protein [Candidatus Krumholzibacteria bacterium]|nr:thioredoxin family protein [Candidatus Krumholzibacteria bacterium]
MFLRNARVALLLVALTLLSSFSAQAEEASSFDEALTMAKTQGKLVLVDFYADWCGPCKHFTADASTVPELKKGLNSVVFFSIDAEKGDGVKLAERYGVRSYPNFLLANAEGNPVYRWVGYGDADGFLQNMNKGLSDPTTLVDKEMRFENSPKVEDAVAIADAALAASDMRKAATWYEKAAKLQGGGYEGEIYMAKYYGLRAGLFTKDEVVDAADAVMAGGKFDDKMMVYQTQQGLASATGDPALRHRYVEDAWKLVKDDNSPEAQSMRDYIAIDYALYVEKDLTKAANLKYDSMPEGWLKDPDRLNQYAWWCFENKVDLERAEQLARKGSELAQEGPQRAAILDTAAELCNALGNCDDAVSLAEQAKQNDPQNDYYTKQLQRFRELAEKNAG